MNQDEIIEMARQAGMAYEDKLEVYVANIDDLQDFAKLVEAKVEARYMQLFLDPENQPTQFGTATQEYREQEILEEREACAKTVEKIETYEKIEKACFKFAAKNIRARGQA